MVTKEQCQKICETELYKTLLNYIRVGKRNAVKSSVLIDLLSVDERQLRAMMVIIRLSGICVLSDDSGYYYPESEEEIRRYIKRVKKSIRSQSITLNTAKTVLKLFEQKERG